MRSLTEAAVDLVVGVIDWARVLVRCVLTAVLFLLLLPELWALGQRIQMAQRPAGSVN